MAKLTHKLEALIDISTEATAAADVLAVLSAVLQAYPGREASVLSVIKTEIAAYEDMAEAERGGPSDGANGDT